jgi:NAD(P)H dehydrogenase (quinone)
MTSTVFLIGATGHIGRALLDELSGDLQQGRLRVRVAARSRESRDRILSAGFEPVQLDLNEPGGFRAALAGSERVFLLRPYTLRHMMMGKQVIDAAVSAGASAIVMLSAYGRPDTPWPVIGWQHLVDAYAERSGLMWTHLRPNYFMDNILVQRDRATNVIYNSISRPVSWIASDDIAAVAAAVLRNPQAHAGRAYPLAAVASGLDEICVTLSAYTGRPHTHAVPDTARLMERLLAQGREPDYARALIDYIDAVNAGRVPEIADTYDTVAAVAGRPAMGWVEFLDRHREAL